MELWVRSQDRKTLMKITRLYEFSNAIFSIDSRENEIILGIYKNEKKALEVLDDIQKLLMPTYLISNITKKEGMKLQDNLSFGTNMIQTNDSSSIEQINGALVFQMPEEED